MTKINKPQKMPSLRENIFDSIELHHLLYAISKFFPMVIYVNLTRNTYKMLEYEQHTTKTSPLNGVFDVLIDAGVASVDPMHKKIFYDTFSRESLLEAYARGETSVVLDVRQRGDDGVYRWIKTNVIFLTNEENNDIIEISLSRPIVQEKARELENLRLRSILEMTMLANYEYISLVDIKTGLYELLANDSCNTHQVPAIGDYDRWAASIRDTLVLEEEREEYYGHANLTNLVARIKDNNGHYSFRYRLNDTPEQRWREAVYFYYLPEDEILMTIRDVHDEILAEQAKRIEEELRRTKERQQILTGLGFDVIIDIDLMTFTAELLGDAKSFLQRDLICENFPHGEINAGMIHPEDVATVSKAFYTQDASTFSIDYRCKRGSEGYFWCRCKAVILRDETGRPYRCLGKLTDIDDQKKREQKLLHNAQRDLLTGLYNNMTTQRLSDDFFSGEGLGSRHALMVVDMDNFKQINDNWGHKTGDKLLQAIAETFNAAFRSSDIIGRIGGDEFVVILKNINSHTEIQERANILRKHIMEIRLEEADNQNTTFCSIGVALYPDDGMTYSEIFNAADKALYYLKKHGKNGVTVYDKTLKNTY